MDTNKDITAGYQEQFVFLERFNMRAADLALFVDDPGHPDAPVHLRTDTEDTGSVYLRNMFMPRRFYQVPTLGDGDTWFFVLENKVQAG